MLGAVPCPQERRNNPVFKKRNRFLYAQNKMRIIEANITSKYPVPANIKVGTKIAS